MGNTQDSILTINSGSSSVKLALFATESLEQTLEVTVTNIGQPNATLKISGPDQDSETQTIQATNHTVAMNAALEKLGDQLSPETLGAIGHRIVHGGHKYDGPVVITDDVVEELQRIAPFDPEHMKSAIGLIGVFDHHFPDTPQIACFDTAFYAGMPAIARLLPLPRKFEKLGLRRYGFHGLSYEYLLQQFREHAGETAAHGRIVMAHLGSGASLTAVKDGKPLDTTMSFTPASGVPMSTRSGDLDPGIVAFLRQQTGMSIEEFNHMVHFESGLLGVSEKSADMELLIRESDHDQYAAEAVDLFCYQVRKAIGSFAAVLGGLDSLIFAGGMGENAPVIREKVCQGLDYLGISLDEQRDQNHEFLISRDGSGAGVHVIHTDEAAIIATQTKQTIQRKDG